MTDQAIHNSAGDHLDIQEMRRAASQGDLHRLDRQPRRVVRLVRLSAFALYFAPAFFPPAIRWRSCSTPRCCSPSASSMRRSAAGCSAISPTATGGGALTLSVSDVLGSLIIAVTPTYATIGVAAPAILALARIIQGLASAANTAPAPPTSPRWPSRASRLLFELPVRHADRRPAHGNHRAAPAAKGFLTPEQLKAWGWRIPFFIGALSPSSPLSCGATCTRPRRSREARKLAKPTGSIRGTAAISARAVARGRPDRRRHCRVLYLHHLHADFRQTVSRAHRDQTSIVIFGSLIFATCCSRSMAPCPTASAASRC